ncbi:MAG TPA: hypothetical protein PK095_16370, partial [Myxococcota bacterium]|nr:hypothetical protein [Myxococcota bacterium]
MPAVGTGVESAWVPSWSLLSTMRLVPCASASQMVPAPPALVLYTPPRASMTVPGAAESAPS